MSEPVYRTAVPKYMSVKAFSMLFDVSEMTILRLVHAGEIEAVRLGRAIRIPITEVKRFEHDALMEGS